MSDGTLRCDIAIIGGGMGGVAAALAACDAGMRVVLTEPTDWLGGQITSQGVSAPDEHPHIESFGGTRSYYALRNAIRDHYRQHYHAPATMPDGQPLNPGNGWVSRLCFEPRVGVRVIDQMLDPHVKTGSLTILREHTPVAAQMDGDLIRSIELYNRHNEAITIEAAYFLDATEWGDLLPLVGAQYVTGAESRDDTGEPHAPLVANPDQVQGFTFCFAVEHRPGEDHTVPKPEGYEQFRDGQPYSLTLFDHDGAPRSFGMFETSPEGLPPFWSYRRLLDGALLDPSGHTRDIAMINWAGNDYHGANPIDKGPEEQDRVLGEAKRLAIGFLYWLQTEAPRPDGGQGYPGLRLLPEVMGTQDGLSKAPYIREARRIVALQRIVEGEIAADGRAGARAERFSDSIGVGWYHIDLHESVGGAPGMYAPTLPFQIPLGALIPIRITNLLAACKNIGTTHVTNGAYRLHPVEWNIGEAAGALAALCLRSGTTPRTVREDRVLLIALQRALLARGVPIAWTIDVPIDDPLFAPTQLLAAHGAIDAPGARFDRLEIMPDQPIGPDERDLIGRALRAIGVDEIAFEADQTWRDVCAWMLSAWASAGGARTIDAARDTV
jgi:hypothetical protein